MSKPPFTAIKMAYRRTRQSVRGESLIRYQSRYLKRLLRIPVLENKVDNQIKQLNVQLPSSSSNLDLDDCCLMSWGYGVTVPWHDIWPRGVSLLARYSAYVAPPLPGSPFDDISPIEFLNYQGTQPPMDPTSGGERKHKHFLQCSYLDRVYQQSPHLGCSPLHLGCICTLYVLRARLDW